MVLVSLLSDLGGLFKVKGGSDIDSAVFKLHYKVTSAFLFAFCLLVTAKGLVGDPINCVRGDNSRLQNDVVNTYCWIHTTFTLPKYLHNQNGKNKHVLYPGVGIDKESDEKIYHAYYQWVPFALFLQGLMFYTPHWLWKAWEGKKIESMVVGLSNPVIGYEQRKDKVRILADYLYSSLHRQNCYAIKFLLCEVLNFLNAIFNMWFLNKFIGGLFLSFGIDAANYTQRNQEERTDPLIVLFPRVTKCTFLMYGVSGTIEKHDLMCVLALNVINEKIYLFLWFWFVLLSCVSGLALIYRCAIFFLPLIRIGLLHKKAKIKYKNSSKVMARKLQVGDCFTLHLLSKNIEWMAFSLLMEELYLRLEAQTNLNQNIELALHGNPENFRLLSERT